MSGAIEELEAEVGPLPPLPESDASQIRAIPSDRIGGGQGLVGLSGWKGLDAHTGKRPGRPRPRPQPGDRVLDLSAPGSKAGHLAWPGASKVN